MVVMNRYVLENIVDIIKFIGAHQLTLRGHDESEGHANRGMFKNLVSYTSQMDITLPA